MDNPKPLSDVDAELQLGTYAARASEKDVETIAPRLEGMKRGKIEDLWENVLALWAMVKDPEAGLASKAIAVGALLYLVSPMDAIPDVIPVLGLSDDAAVILAAVGALSYQLLKYKKKVK